MRHYFKSYWFWFYLAIAVISVLDFIDHVTREESYYRDIWLQWLLFTIGSTLIVCLCIYFFNGLLIKVFRKKNLITQSIAILLAALMHMYISGYVLDLLIFGHSTLIFRFNLTILLIALGLFYFIRVATNVGLKVSTKKIR